jgi:hypothetical protein
MNFWWMKATSGLANSARHFLKGRGPKGSPWAPRVPGKDVTNIRPERIDAPQADELNTVLVIIVGIFMIALVISYAGYCFYATAEKIKETSDRRENNLQ